MKKPFKKSFISLMFLTSVVSFSFMNFNSVSKNYETTNVYQTTEVTNNLHKDDFTINKSLPAKYDPRTNNYEWTLKVKDQNSNWCWAYSLSTAAENNLLKHKYYPKLNNLEYEVSPNNIVTIGTNRTKDHDKLGLTYDHIEKINNNNGHYLHDAAMRLTQWQGIKFQNSWSSATSEVVGYLKNISKIKNVTNIDDVNSIKELVYEYGGVSFEYDTKYISGGLFDSEENQLSKYFTIKKGRTEHASVIVGWDDSIKKEEFVGKYGIAKELPSRDGAWIVKNSYGEGPYDKGYYYASYDSEFMNCLAVDFAPNNDYSKGGATQGYSSNLNNYYYDSRDASYNINDSRSDQDRYDQFAAIYPTLKNTYNKQEILDKVAFEIQGKNVELRVDIYKNLENIKFGLPKALSNNPTNGLLVHSQIAKYEYPGFHTLDLSKKIKLDQNKNFSVVITILSGDRNNGNPVSILSASEYSSKNDMTFYRSKDEQWKNTLTFSNYVARVRGITYTEEIPNAETNANNLNYAQIRFNKHDYVYGHKDNLDFDVIIGDTKLTRDVDYIIKSDEHQLGEPGKDFSTGAFNDIVANGTVTIEGKGRYIGSLSKQYPLFMPSSGLPVEPSNPDPEPTPDPNPVDPVDPVDPTPNPDPNPDPIVKQDISTATISLLNNSFEYTGKPIEPQVTVSLNGNTLVLGKDYTLSYGNNINVGNANITVNGINNYQGSANSSFAITKPLVNEIQDFKIENNKPVASSKFGEVAFRYSKDPNFLTNVLYEYPNESGEYYVQAYVKDNNNFAGALSSQTLKINVVNTSNNPNDLVKPWDTKNDNNLTSDQIIIIVAISLAAILVTTVIGLITVKLVKSIKKRK